MKKGERMMTEVNGKNFQNIYHAMNLCAVVLHISLFIVWLKI